MPQVGLALAAVISCLGLAACGSDAAVPRTSPVATFDANPYGERVFEAYGKTGILTRELNLPKGSREIMVNLDCAGNTGKLEVNFSAAGGAGIQCTDAANTEGGRVGLSGDGSLLPRNQTITITGPNDQPWSVAIDAGAKVTGN